jgi:lipopolysaccharide export system protein LptA
VSLIGLVAGLVASLALEAAPGGAAQEVTAPAATTAQAPGATAPAITSGRPIQSSAPVTVDAQEVRFNWKTHLVTVVGKPLVTLVHDDATLTCRRLTGENDAAGKLSRAVCEGDVKLVRSGRVVTCERATYDRVGARVVCTGQPILREPGGVEARGTSLTYDLAADEVSLETASVTIPPNQVDLATQRGVTRPAAAGGTP